MVRPVGRFEAERSTESPSGSPADSLEEYGVSSSSDASDGITDIDGARFVFATVQVNVTVSTPGGAWSS